MLSFFKTTFTKIYAQVTDKLSGLLQRSTYDESILAELETILIAADTGTKTTHSIIESVKKKWHANPSQPLKDHLEKTLIEILDLPYTHSSTPPCVYALVGINGCGKTTLAAKLAHYHRTRGHKVLFVGTDTFRAAADSQLGIWASKLDVPVISGSHGQDPASVLFTGCDLFLKEKHEVLIIDTAGRLHTKVNLMQELAKMMRVLEKKLPSINPSLLLTVDSMLGQSSLEQARLFAECTKLSGIVLTKMDGTGKGGIIFSIVQELKIPIAYITYGEKSDQLKTFTPHEYVNGLLNT